MKCENCNKKNATTYYKQIVNGKIKEVYLCSDCASKLGIGASMFSEFDLMFPSFMTGQSQVPENKKCICGMTFAEIAHSGFVGCSMCYDTFKAELEGLINKTHGGKRHIGRIASKRHNTSPAESSKEEKKDLISDLKNQLATAIKEENFEQAAVIRDRIKAAENERENNV